MDDILKLLDLPVTELKDRLQSLTLDQLSALLTAEKAGKTRKGAVVALTEAAAALRERVEIPFVDGKAEIPAGSVVHGVASTPEGLVAVVDVPASGDEEPYRGGWRARA